MRYRGGGVGHTSTREATDWFLKDRDPLDTASEQARAAESQNTPMDHDADKDDGEGEGEGENWHEWDENETEGGARQERDTVDEGHGESGSINGDEEVNEHEEADEDEIDEEIDYGYVLYEEGLERCEEEDLIEGELADDALGAEDGEEVEDELDNLGYGAL